MNKELFLLKEGETEQTRLQERDNELVTEITGNSRKVSAL
jgi:hypothetical protein